MENPQNLLEEEKGSNQHDILVNPFPPLHQFLIATTKKKMDPRKGETWVPPPKGETMDIVTFSYASKT